MVRRSRRLAARLWWFTLPYAGWVGYRDVPGGNPTPWYAFPLAWLNTLASKLPGSDPFEPSPVQACDCDFCRGVPGAEYTP